MSQLTKAVGALRPESQFSKAYCAMGRMFYWDPYYEDSMNLIAKLPVMAATIYNNLYREGATPCPIDTTKDWSHNYTSMMGYSDPKFTEFMRLYLTVHR